MSKTSKIIDTQYKLGFLVKIAVILLVSAVVSAFIFYNFVDYKLGHSYTNTIFLINSVNEFLFPSLWLSITILTLLLAIGTIIVSIFVSHKIAGPLYRIETTLKDMKNGILYRINLRVADQMTGLATLLNDFIDYLMNDIKDLTEKSSNLKELIYDEKYKLKNEAINYDEISSFSNNVKSEITNIMSTVNDYKIADTNK